MLGASFDSVENNRAFADKFRFPFRLLSDPRKTLATYDAIDPDDPDWPRRISYLIGPDGRVVTAYAHVNAATHPAQVLADLAGHGL